ncbi:TauD/TfdA family dioxygenase [Ramlibacter sp.]|uniref:TauD/TfdA family dioxygenase n=1 Tax=Ramlibacter sp. TaxID=1917967 RepID=UPI003D149287
MRDIRPITGPFVWHGKDMEKRSEAWTFTVTPAEVEELDRAIRGVLARGLELHQTRPSDFPLPMLGPRLKKVAHELEHGRGFVLLRGIEGERYSDEWARYAVWGVGAHLGIPVSQSKNGELLGEVTDVGVKLHTPTSRGYRTKEHLRFHTDHADLVLLYCARKARTGGLSRVISSVDIHNEMLKRRPDLLPLLFEDYYFSRQGEEGPGQGPWYAKPVFSIRDGFFSNQYSRSFVESAQRFPEVPRITPAQDEALDLLAQIADERCLEMEMQPGDIQILNNHVTLHSRTSYEDHEEPGKKRLLYRLWLSTPDNRPLDERERVLWGEVEAGTLRGGVIPASGQRYAFTPAESETQDA